MAYNFITDPSGYMDSQEFADIITGICGDGTIVLDVGQKMEASMADVNTLRIMDGVVISGNQIIGIAAGTSVDFVIPAGTDGVNNTYYVGYRLSKGDTQAIEPIVHKTMTNTGTRLRNGDTVQKVYLYKVTQKGYVVDKITPLFAFNGKNNTETAQDKVTVTFTDTSSTSQKTLTVYLEKKNGFVFCNAHNVLDVKSAKTVTLSGAIPAGYRPSDINTSTATLVNNSKKTGDARVTIDGNGVLKYVANATGWQEFYFSTIWPAEEV